MKKIVSLALALALPLAMAACGGNNATPSNSPAPPSPGMEPSSGSVSAPGEESSATILIAAAASLELVLRDRLIPAFREQHPGIAVEGSYDSSGKLQRQIEEGLPADLFLSAAQAQMDALVDQGLVDRDSVLPLLENELVLIVPTGQENAISPPLKSCPGPVRWPSATRTACRQGSMPGRSLSALGCGRP